MMRLKNFSEYGIMHAKDPRTFEKKVIFACSENYGIPAFELVKSPYDFKNNLVESPIIRWNSFDFNTSLISESAYVFNKVSPPKIGEALSSFSGESFIPKSTRDRKEVKRLKFPISAYRGDEKEDFKTYGKFKNSEKLFDLFREKLIPLTRFDVIAHRKKPIHLQERINGIGFDVDLASFEKLSQIKSIAEAIHSKYPIDFYHLELIESKDNLYLTDFTTSHSLSPSQCVKMYEAAYETFYESKLPNFFRKNLFENYIQPYYQKRYYDALLIKPKNSIDFKKFAPRDHH